MGSGSLVSTSAADKEEKLVLGVLDGGSGIPALALPQHENLHKRIYELAPAGY